MTVLLVAMITVVVTAETIVAEIAVITAVVIADNQKSNITDK
jgi:hypothetical protein